MKSKKLKLMSSGFEKVISSIQMARLRNRSNSNLDSSLAGIQTRYHPHITLEFYCYNNLSGEGNKLLQGLQ
jgi:hypothetical protein